MKLLGLWLTTFILLSFSGGEKYELIPVESIIEISGGENMLQLEDDIKSSTDEFDDLQYLKLCLERLCLIQNIDREKIMQNLKDEKMKAYAIMKSHTKEMETFVEIVFCYKWSNHPTMYIQIKANERKDDPTILIFFKVDSPLFPLEKIVKYELKKVERIIEADVNLMMKAPRDSYVISPCHIDAWSEEERLQICKKVARSTSDAEGERIDIKYLEQTPTGAIKYYSVVFIEMNGVKESIMKLYDCPTEPKIHISVGHEEQGYVVQALLSTMTYASSSSQTVSKKVIEGLRFFHPCTLADYFETKNRIGDSNNQQEDDLNTKNRLCILITSSKMFKHLRFKPINILIMPEDLRQKCPEMFVKKVKVFESETDSTRVVTEYYALENSTKKMKVYARFDKNVLENVFICPIRRIREFEKHFISEEYNMNYASDSASNYIADRFMFRPSYSIGRIKVYGIAEEPARAVLEPDSTRKNVELLYLERRSTHQPANVDSDDPICQLSMDQKIRLCGLIFRSEYYNDEFDFFPSNNVIGYNRCNKRTVSLRNKDMRAKTNGVEYEEWMIVCYLSSLPYPPDGHDAINSLTYYLSRAYNDSNPDALSANDVFVYHQESDEYYLQQSFTNVRLKY